MTHPSSRFSDERVTPASECVDFSVQVGKRLNIRMNPADKPVWSRATIEGVVVDPQKQPVLGPGHAILAVEGRDVAKLGFQGAIEAIRGPEGSVVHLTVAKGEGEAQIVPVRRKKIRS